MGDLGVRPRSTHGRLVAGDPLLGRGQPGDPADEGDVAVAQRQQIAGQVVRGRGIVHDDLGGLETARGQGDDLGALAGGRRHLTRQPGGAGGTVDVAAAEHDPGRLMLAQHAELRALLRRVTVRIRQHRDEALSGRLDLDAAGHLREVRVEDVAGDHADDLAALLLQRLRRRAGHVAQGFGRGPDRRADLGTHRMVGLRAVQHPRCGGDRYRCLLRDVAQRGHGFSFWHPGLDGPEFQELVYGKRLPLATGLSQLDRQTFATIERSTTERDPVR